MLDPILLRTQTEQVARLLKERRNIDLDVEFISSLEAKRVKLQTFTEETQARRNQIAKEVGKLRSQGENADALIAESNELAASLTQASEELVQVQSELYKLAISIPNIQDDSVPVGKDETENLEISRWGTPRQFDFDIKDHVDLGELTGGIDFKSAVKLTGSRFVVFKGAIARLHRALIQFMLDTHYHAGYEELYLPYMVNQDSLDRKSVV